MTTGPLNSTPIPSMHRGTRRFISWSSHLRRLSTPQNAIALASLTFSAVIFHHLQQNNLLSEAGLQGFIHDAGPIAPLLFMVLMALTVVVSHLPGVPLVCVAGAMWGGVWGGIYSVAGGFLGSLMAYGLGRSLGQSAIKFITGKTVTFNTHRGQAVLGGLIFLSRLLPVVPFDVISYGAGMTRLSLPVYASATLLGMMPPTFAIAFLGTSPGLNPFTNPGIGVMLLGVLVLLPLGIWRYNWLGLRTMVQVD